MRQVVQAGLRAWIRASHDPTAAHFAYELVMPIDMTRTEQCTLLDALASDGFGVEVMEFETLPPTTAFRVWGAGGSNKGNLVEVDKVACGVCARTITCADNGSICCISVCGHMVCKRSELDSCAGRCPVCSEAFRPCDVVLL